MVDTTGGSLVGRDEPLSGRASGLIRRKPRDFLLADSRGLWRRRKT
jgi:hypothetical protein